MSDQSTYSQDQKQGKIKVCKFPECGKLHHAHGYCGGHAKQLECGKTLTFLQQRRPMNSEPIIKYIEVPCSVDGISSPCHEWTGGKIKAGYGAVCYKGKIVRVHRYVWEKVNGEIPEGLVIDHICRNRACCNVWHLRVVTRQVNNTENIQGAIWHVRSSQTHCLRGHPFEGSNLFLDKHGHRYCRACRAFRRQKNRDKRAAK